MEELIASPAKDYSSLPAALAVIPLVRAERIVALLRQRAVALELEISEQRSNLLITGGSRLQRLGAEFQEALWRTEAEYVRRVADEIEASSLD